MMLLDAFMDALTSLFPDLSRPLPTRGGPGLGTTTAGGEKSGEGGFAATLLNFLGGRGAVLPPGTTQGGSSGTTRAATEEGASGSDLEEAPFYLSPTSTAEGNAVRGPVFPVGATSVLAPADEVPGERTAEGVPTVEEEGAVPSGATEPTIEESTPSEGTGASDARAAFGDTPPGTEVATSSVPSGLPSPEEISAPARTASMGAADRDEDKLDPVLRSRLQRVMERMESEFGHRVAVVEGYRSPERQEALYRQGRSEDGPVVTWTRQSLHSQGRAVDVQVDGRWETHEGYARLQKVAQEEGLVTLGARDPGHLELPEGEGARWEDLGDGPGDRSELVASRAARPARVASPAAVARVARVARPGWGGAQSAEARWEGGEASMGAGSVGRRAPQAAPVSSAEPPAISGMRMATPVTTPSVEPPVTQGTRVAAPTAPPLAEPQAVPETRVAVPSAPPLAVSRAVPETRVAAPSSPPAISAIPEIPPPEWMGDPPRIRAVALGPGAMRTAAGSGRVEAAPAPAAAAAPRLTSNATGQDRRRSGLREEARASAPVSGDTSAELSASRASFSGASQAPMLSEGWAPSPSPLQGVAGAERIDRIQALEDALDMRLPGRIHLELDDVDGAGTRLRLALRGNQLDGSVGLNDPEAALRMRARIGELHEALSRRGLDTRALDIHSVSGSSARADADVLLPLRDPLTALARMADPREGGTDARTDRGWTQQRDEGGREPRGHRDPARRDRSKEDGR